MYFDGKYVDVIFYFRRKVGAALEPGCVLFCGYNQFGLWHLAECLMYVCNVFRAEEVVVGEGVAFDRADVGFQVRFHLFWVADARKQQHVCGGQFLYLHFLFVEQRFHLPVSVGTEEQVLAWH